MTIRLVYRSDGGETSNSGLLLLKDVGSCLICSDSYRGKGRRSCSTR
jgi:hypothetical protein